MFHSLNKNLDNIMDIFYKMLLLIDFNSKNKNNHVLFSAHKYKLKKRRSLMILNSKYA